MNENNAPLGGKMIEFLIETVQGPCLENQKELCQHTRILEVLEEVNLNLRITQQSLNSFPSRDVIFSNLRYKIFLLQLSMMEGNVDDEIPKKISQFFNPQLLLERIESAYWKIIKKMKNTELEINYQIKELKKQKNAENQESNNYGLVATKETYETVNTGENLMDLYEDDPQIKLNDQSIPQRSYSDQIGLHNIQGDDLDYMIKEAFLMYILLKKLRKFVP